MSPMEILEQERVAYVDEMQEYLHRLKQMNKIDAQKISFNNLVQSQIIYENGEFTEYYNRKLTEEEYTEADNKIRERMLQLRREHTEFLKKKKENRKS